MSRSWVLVVAGLAAAAPVHAQPRGAGIVELRQDLQALQAQIGAMLGQDGQRDVQIGHLSQRVAELADHIASAEMVARAGDDDRWAAMRGELVAAVDQLRTEVAAITYESPTQVDHVGGFVWTTSDEDYQLRIAGYLQARLGVQIRGVADPETEMAEPAQTDGGFTLRRARVILDGVGEHDLGFRIMADLARPEVVDAYLEWATGPVSVRVGRDRVPFTRSSLLAEHRLGFAERAVVAEALAWDRDLGLHVGYVGRRVSARLAIGNGGPSHDPEAAFAGAPLVAYRQELALTGALPDLGAGDFARPRRAALALGAAIVVDPVVAPRAIGDVPVLADVDGDGTDDKVVVAAAGVDLTLRRRGFELALEGIYRYENWGDLLAVNPDLVAALGSSDPTRVHVAGAVEASYVVRGRILTGLRVAYGDRPVLNMHGASAIPPRTRALEVGISSAIYREGMRFVGFSHRVLVDEEPMPAGRRTLEQAFVLEVQGVL
jgi:hypothetical protein